MSPKTPDARRELCAQNRIEKIKSPGNFDVTLHLIPFKARTGKKIFWPLPFPLFLSFSLSHPIYGSPLFPLSSLLVVPLLVVAYVKDLIFLLDRLSLSPSLSLTRLVSSQKMKFFFFIIWTESQLRGIQR